MDVPCRRPNYRNGSRVDGARGRSPHGSPARSASRTSKWTRASIPGAISSALGTLGLSPLRSRAPRPERLFLWIIHQDLAVRLQFVFLASTYSWPQIELGSVRSVKRRSRGLCVNRQSLARVRFLHSPLNHLCIPHSPPHLSPATYSPPCSQPPP